MRRPGINTNYFLIALATAVGLVIGLILSQTGKAKDIVSAEIISPIKSANASPSAPAQNNPPAKPSPEKISKAPDAEKSILRLKDYIKSTEEKSAFLKEKVELLDDLLNSKGKELAKLNTDNAILKENLNQTIELQNKLKAELEQNINSLREQLSQKDADISSLNAAKAGLEGQLAELNNKLSVLSTDYAVLQAKSGSLEQDKSSLESRLGRIREDLDRQEAINDTLNKNVSELTASLAAKEKERLDISVELEQLMSAKANAETELARIKSAKAEADNNINQLNSRISEINALYEEAKKSLFQMSNMLAAKEQLINEKESEASALKDSLVKSDGGKGLLLSALDEKEKVICDLNAALASMEGRIAAMQKELAAQEERQANTSRQLAEAVSLNKNLKMKLKNIYIELEMIRAERQGR
ncbi:MAG: hypothetical protein WC532_08600 [Candidatus Omnitrophota bacterium]